MDVSFFILKIFISALIIAAVSWFVGKNPTLAGFLIALPIMSLLAISFSYFQYRDMEKINQFASSIVVSIPLSLLFFVPFILNRWMKWAFIPSILLGFGLIFLGYLIHSRIFKS
jgi:hypothetical protein